MKGFCFNKSASVGPLMDLDNVSVRSPPEMEDEDGVGGGGASYDINLISIYTGEREGKSGKGEKKPTSSLKTSILVLEEGKITLPPIIIVSPFHSVASTSFSLLLDFIVPKSSHLPPSARFSSTPVPLSSSSLKIEKSFLPFSLDGVIELVEIPNIGVEELLLSDLEVDDDSDEEVVKVKGEEVVEGKGDVIGGANSIRDWKSK